MHDQRACLDMVGIALLGFWMAVSPTMTYAADPSVSPSSKQQSIPPANLAILQSVILKLTTNRERYRHKDYLSYELFPNSKLLYDAPSVWQKHFDTIQPYSKLSNKFIDLAPSKYLPGDIVMVQKNSSRSEPRILVYAGEFGFPDERNSTNERSFFIFPYATKTGMEYNTFPPRWHRTIMEKYDIGDPKGAKFESEATGYGPTINWLRSPRYRGSVFVSTDGSEEFQIIRHKSNSILVIKRGELTTLGEGSDLQTKYIHWPNTPASGVTLGKGYDIGNRTPQQVIRELTSAGMTSDQAKKISKAAGLKGTPAGTFVNNNRISVGEIPLSVQLALLGQMLVRYTAEAKNTATSTVADANYVNAAGREKKDGKKPGTYVMSSAEWGNLHDAMIEFLTDLKYQGQYYGYDRVARINTALRANDGKALQQFKAIRELFTSGYMDSYAASVGEGKGGPGATGNWYGQLVNYQNKYRRNAIRLAYLNHVVAALEAGKTVVVTP